MKITRIYLKNLNSLRGEFTIDLEKESFAQSGIFAITGPTGAGKSTILDAITLALYGRAARYDNKPNPENMMSRGTGECQAEVEFEVSKGRYRASWQMKRARGKADGKLQPVSRYVYNSQDLPIAQSVSEANKIIEELTGLDVDRFFRSVLLAQGDFVRFLKATPDDRASLLESLTGTGIYTEISKRVHEETSSRGNQLKQKEATLEGIKLLDQEELATLTKRQGELQEETQQQAQKLKELEKLIFQGNDVIKYLEDKNKIIKQQASLHQENLTWQNDFHRLRLFRKGIPFYPHLNELDKAIKSCSDQNSEVKREEKNIASSELKLRAATDAAIHMVLKHLTDHEKAFLDTSTTRNLKSTECQDLNVWLEAHAQDQNLDAHLSEMAEHITTLLHLREERKKLQKELDQLSPTLKKNQQLADSYHSKKEVATLNLAKVALDIQACENKHLSVLKGKSVEHIHSEIASLSEQLHHLDKWKEVNQGMQELSKTTLQLAFDSECAQKAMSEAEQNLKTIEETKNQIKEKLDQNRLIASLQEHREKLEPGLACPLCGSLEHPFVQHADTPFSAVSDLEKELKQVEREALIKDHEYKDRISAAARAKEALKNKENEFKKAFEKSESLKTLLKEHGPNDLANMSQIEIELKQHLLSQRGVLTSAKEVEDQKNEASRMLIQAHNDVALIQNEMNSIEKQIQDSSARIEENHKAIDLAQNKIAECESSLLNYLDLFGLKLPSEEEEKKLLLALRERKETYQKRLKSRDDCFAKLNQLQDHMQRLEEQRKHLDAQHESLKSFIEANELTSIESLAHTRQEFSSLWRSIDDAQEELRKQEGFLKTLKAILQNNKEHLQESQKRRLEMESTLSKELLTGPFATIDALRSAQLSHEEAQRIEAKEKEIENLSNRLCGQLEQIENGLNHLINENAPQGELLEDLKQRHQETNELVKNKHAELVLIHKELQDDAKNHQAHAQKLEELTLHRKHLSIWQKLSGLIGSHDGKVFRKFAQGLSLDLLIKCANHHLSLLNNRYRLKRVMGNELDLEIQDLHQANATRPTASLSGGESFLTSLALALGLSDLAGKNVRIDSLFIDEGFGSLDADTLEIAVQALENLRSKNKTIGVISHIELLKERIPTQISIEKGPGGVSTMSFSA